MRALVCTKIGGEEFLEVQELEPEACGPKDVRIDVSAASVNFPDRLVIRDLYQMKKEPPFVPGNECAGVVSETGAEVTGFAVGDRVLALIGTGAFAEDVVVHPPMQIHRIPDEMPFDHAAAFNLTYGTAAIGWERGALQPGESVLINGAAGGCGSAAIQIAKAIGAHVIAVAGGGDKVALCKELGADHTIDHLAVEAIAPVVKAGTGGRGVAVLLDKVVVPYVVYLLV
jgi:NADPH2:quinone reductase